MQDLTQAERETLRLLRQASPAVRHAVALLLQNLRTESERPSEAGRGDATPPKGNVPRT